MWNRTPWWREAANDRAGALEPLHLALPPPRSRGEEQAARVAATFRPLQERRDARRRHFAPTRDCPGWNREASRDDVSLARFWGSRARKLSMTRATRPQPRWLQTAITITSPMQILLRHPFASGPSGRAGRPEMAARGKAQPRGKEAASLHERADLQGDRRSESAADLRRLVSSPHGLDRRQLLLQWRNHLGGTPPAHLPSWLLTRVLAYRLQAAVCKQQLWKRNCAARDSGPCPQRIVAPNAPNRLLRPFSVRRLRKSRAISDLGESRRFAGIRTNDPCIGTVAVPFDPLDLELDLEHPTGPIVDQGHRHHYATSSSG